MIVLQQFRIFWVGLWSGWWTKTIFDLVGLLHVGCWVGYFLEHLAGCYRFLLRCKAMVVVVDDDGGDDPSGRIGSALMCCFRCFSLGWFGTNFGEGARVGYEQKSKGVDRGTSTSLIGGERERERIWWGKWYSSNEIQVMWITSIVLLVFPLALFSPCTLKCVVLTLNFRGRIYYYLGSPDSSIFKLLVFRMFVTWI